MTDNFAKHRKIDPSQLDIEAVQQAELFFKYAEQAVKAKSKAEKLKFKLEVTEANLSLDCRANPEDFGLVKPTENAIASAIKSNDKYIKLHNEYLDACEEYSMCDKMVNALEQKKRMIEVLVTLHGQQYFAGPSVPRDIIQTWKDHQENLERRVNEKQKRRLERCHP